MKARTPSFAGAKVRTWWQKGLLVFLLSCLAICVSSVTPTRAALMGCVTGCDCLSCVHEPGNCSTQGWYYFDGQCCWTWVSRTADNTKQPTQAEAGRQRKKCSYLDCCVTTTLWGEATNCWSLSGNPTLDTCRFACTKVSN